jgi:hypothetical protein
MPVILDQQDWPMWLGEIEGDARRVGSPRTNGPELLEAIAASLSPDAALLSE